MGSRRGCAGSRAATGVLYSFSGDDGASPIGGLILDQSGALYGTTLVGGAYGVGTVFMLTPPAVPGGGWNESVLYSFTGTDGAYPLSTLILDNSGALYGTTECTHPHCPLFGSTEGTVFKLTPPQTSGRGWTKSVLHYFTGADGAGPEVGLIFDKSGALYGTAFTGGTGCAPFGGCGTVFKLTPPAADGEIWNLSVLHNFTFSDGASPVGSLIFDKSGALYGTTRFGGTGDCPSVDPYGSCGTVFELTAPATDGGAWTLRVLHNFSFTDGANPIAVGLIFDNVGALYGTTEEGGNCGQQPTFFCGTVFKLIPPQTNGGTWTEIVLHNFPGGNGGGSLQANLIFDKFGSLYGTTEEGSSTTSCPLGVGYSCGTVFKLSGVTFAGIPRQSTCIGSSNAALARQYGGLAAAASALGYDSIRALQSAMVAYCMGS
jgi:hypothetical protein